MTSPQQKSTKYGILTHFSNNYVYLYVTNLHNYKYYKKYN